MTVRLVVRWIFAVVFGLIGLIVIFNSFITGALFILAAVILLPPANTFAKEKWNFALSGPLKFIIVLILVIAAPVIGVIKPTAEIVKTINENAQNTQLVDTTQTQSDVKPATQTATPPPQPVQKPTPPPAPKSAPPPPVKVEPLPINLSGGGQQASQKFTLEKGLSIFKLTYSGSGHFGVWLLDSEGNNVDLLANNTGSFNGSKAVGIVSAGMYLLDVSASGPWTVTIEQPRPLGAAAMPTSLAGVGPQATQLVTLPKGLETFTLTHDGSGHFSIWLLDSKGNNVDLLVNQTGAFNGSKAVKIPQTGIYLFSISADGDWTIQR